MDDSPECITLNDSEEQELSNVPSREECEELIDKFVEVTKTNSAEAQQFLQENQWNLEQATSAFYSADGNDDVEEVSPDSDVVEQLFGKGKKLTSEPPPRLQLLSWNLDGLDERCLNKRMLAVVGIIQRLEPDVIYLQEVIDSIAAYLERKLPEYKFHRGESQEGYYNVTLTRVFTVRYDGHTIVPFPDTRMGRHYVLTRVHIGERHFALLNTHLESGKEFGQERVNQLKRAFKDLQNIPPEVTVILGGDLNLRDGEASSTVPSTGWLDSWEVCGSKADFRWTWDTRRNTNKGFGPNGPRARFDRIYVRPEAQKIRILDFGLVGAQRAPPTSMFPSDHWGLVVCLQLKHST